PEMCNPQRASAYSSSQRHAAKSATTDTSESQSNTLWLNDRPGSANWKNSVKLNKKSESKAATLWKGVIRGVPSFRSIFKSIASQATAGRARTTVFKDASIGKRSVSSGSIQKYILVAA